MKLCCVYNNILNFEFKIQTGNTTWDLTGYTGTMTVRPFVGSTKTTLLATTDNGKVVMNASPGTVTVTFTATDTNITAESYVYDFVLNSGSVITRLLEGKFIVTAGVTV
jgi:hypothetical protein